MTSVYMTFCLVLEPLKVPMKLLRKNLTGDFQVRLFSSLMMMMFLICGQKIAHISEELLLQQEIFLLFLVVLFLLRELFLLLWGLLLTFPHPSLITQFKHMCVYQVGFMSIVLLSRTWVKNMILQRHFIWLWMSQVNKWSGYVFIIFLLFLMITKLTFIYILVFYSLHFSYSFHVLYQFLIFFFPIFPGGYTHIFNIYYYFVTFILTFLYTVYNISLKLFTIPI